MEVLLRKVKSRSYGHRLSQMCEIVKVFNYTQHSVKLESFVYSNLHLPSKALYDLCLCALFLLASLHPWLSPHLRIC